jgi:hypothetical protein
MHLSSIRQPHIGTATTLALTLALAGTAHAQGRSGCQVAAPPAIGIAFGRSSPYLEPSRDLVGGERSGSILVYSGPLISGRGDFSIAGPWRVRIEGSTARWDVVDKAYSPIDGQVLSSTSVGHIDARRIGAAIGLRGGRDPLCAHVLAGWGLYSLTFRDITTRRPGVAITAGMEIPTGSRGAVQLDVDLHLINNRNSPLSNSSTVLAASLSIGWAFRF